MKAIAVIGASGAIGSALVSEAERRYPEARIFGFSRSGDCRAPISVSMDPCDETSIEEALAGPGISLAFDAVLMSTGLLHTPDFGPEKSLRDIDAATMKEVLAVNTVAPALVMKHFLKRMARDRRAVFGCLSARVGSISDNRSGGWYAYRASKAALNMLIRNASIEMARRYTELSVVALHPGTVDSPLSKPFQRAVPDGKLFTPDYAAARLWDVVEQVEPADSGGHFAWDGNRIEA